MAHRLRLLYALGALFILIAATQSILKVSSGGAILEAVIDFVLIGFPGVLILFVGRWLSYTDFDPALYPRIVLWCLGGVSVMLVFLILRAIHPGVTTEFTFGTRAIALSIGSIAGLVIGIHEAQALTREQEVEQRNEELLEIQERLERALQQVEASNERLEQFAYAASHDLQEPLRMISSYLQLLDDRYSDALDEDGQEFVDFAVDGAERMQTMIDDLLQYSRIDTQGDPFEPVDLDTVVDDACTDLQVRIDESDAVITTEELPHVEGDSSQLRQLVQNLLENAIEYSGDEPPRIHVSAEKRGHMWEISVSDEGIGIEPDDQKRIFEIFQRLHTVDEHDGSGIGLALCQRIVERHNGEIWVDSEPGNGSTFSFTIPASGEIPIQPDPSPNG